jgi:hypothetical protein
MHNIWMSRSSVTSEYTLMIQIISPTSRINFERIIFYTRTITMTSLENYLSLCAKLLHYSFTKCQSLRNLCNYHTLIRFTFSSSEGPDMTWHVSEDVTYLIVCLSISSSPSAFMNVAVWEVCALHSHISGCASFLLLSFPIFRSKYILCLFFTEIC